MSNEPEQVEKCNFKETLDKWEYLNMLESAGRSTTPQPSPRRCVSAPFSSSNVPTTSGENEAITLVAEGKELDVIDEDSVVVIKATADRELSLVEGQLQDEYLPEGVKKRKDGNKSEDYEPPDQTIYSHNLKVNSKFPKDSIPRFTFLDPVNTSGKKQVTLIGRCTLRSSFGEARSAETKFSCTHELSIEMRDLQKPTITPFAESYTSQDGSLFNFDALVYDLARLSVLSQNKSSDGFSRYMREGFSFQLEKAKAIKGSLPQVFIKNAEQYFTFDPHSGEGQVADSADARRVCLLFSLAKAQGSQTCVNELKNNNYPVKGAFRPHYYKALFALKGLYADVGRRAEFCVAYLAGIHSAIRISGPGKKPFFVRDVLLSLEFAKPAGDLGLIMKSWRSHAGEYYLPKLDCEAFISAALITVSDPGSPFLENWTPSFSRSTHRRQRLGDISKNALQFFECWLHNYSALLFDRTYKKSPPVLSHLLYALRNVQSEHLCDRVLYPWYGIEPNFILEVSDVYCHYRPTLHLAIGETYTIEIPGIQDLKEIKAVNDSYVLSMNWVSMRENLLLWILAEENIVSIGSENSVQEATEDANYLPSFISHHALSGGPIIVTVKNDGFYGSLESILQDEQSTHSVFLTAYPLDVVVSDGEETTAEDGLYE